MHCSLHTETLCIDKAPSAQSMSYSYITTAQTLKSMGDLPFTTMGCGLALLPGHNIIKPD